MRKETASNVALFAPAIESLLARSKVSLWPAEILYDADLIRQADMRRKLYGRMETLFRNMPEATMDIAEAVKAGTVRSEELAEIYELLAAFLDADPHHRRIILYLPFELIPPSVWWRNSDGLQSSSDHFVRSYMRCWRELLEEIDVRANFFDGNILERELAPNGQPLVCKAAHLIPQLVRKGLISTAYATSLMEDASSEVLKDSIADALAALAPSMHVAKTIDEFSVDRLDHLHEEIAFELRKLDMREALDNSRGMPPARVAWERKDNEDTLISTYAERIAPLINARLPSRRVLQFVTPKYPRAVRLAAMRGFGSAVEGMTTTDRFRSERISKTFIECIESEWLDEPEISDELEGILARWVSLRIATETDLQKFGFALPKLDANFSKTGPLSTDIQDFSDVIGLIAREPEYSRLLYPVALFFGSRLKGYAKRNADLDAAVFVRPGTSGKERATIRGILAKHFQAKNIGGKVVEFWLEDDAQGLKIRDFPDPDVFLADSTWVNLLFASVWLGAEETVRELYEKLLPGLLRSADKTFMGRDIRTISLGEMEREVLQYRLMHKGYRRFFPPAGGIDEGATGLDPSSTFWDSGYRRLATKLFVSRVFLPQLNAREDPNT